MNKKYIINFGIFLLILGLFFGVYAFSFPNTSPTGETAGGGTLNFSKYLSNIQTDCGNGKYIEGFQTDGKPVCKSKSTSFPNGVVSITSKFPSALSGNFSTYLKQILQDCGNNGYVVGFDTNGNIVCRNKAGTESKSNITYTPIVSVSFPNSQPTGETSGGIYTQKFTQILQVNCGANKYLQGFDSSGNKICKSVVKGTCGSAHNTNPSQGVQSYPTSNLCTSGTHVAIDQNGTDGQFNWTCKGDLGGDQSCGVNRLFTATFDANEGGTPNPTKIVKVYNSPLGTLPTTSRLGYTFKGWFTTKTGGTQIQTTTKLTANVTYYAQWKQDFCTLGVTPLGCILK